MAAAQPKVGIALLNWNQYDDTALCLSSLRESLFRPAIILVYDNGSIDGSAERLQADFPEIQLVKGGQNYGFSEGNNRAARILLDAGMDYVWVLNNDTKVPPDCLGILVDVLREDPGVGAASAKIWFMDESKPLSYAGGTFNRWTFDTCYLGLREQDVGQYDTATDTEVFSGCCMLIRAEVLRKIGLFNKAFFIYAEDIEWSVRAMEAGVRQRYEPRATLWHKMYGSSRTDGKRDIPKSSPRVEFLLARNRFILVRLHTRPWTLRRGVALGHHLFVRRLPRAAGLLLKPNRRAAGLAIFKGLWAGLWMKPDPADCQL
jgi:GT2 family glycosyltransferase